MVNQLFYIAERYGASVTPEWASTMTVPTTIRCSFYDLQAGTRLSPQANTF